MLGLKELRLRPSARLLLLGIGTLGVLAYHPVLAAAPSTKIVTYDAPQGEVGSQDYSVSVNGRSVFVYSAATYKSAPASFANFDFSGTAVVTIQAASQVHGVRILPSSLGIKSSVDGHQIQFELSQPCNVTVEINGSYAKALHLFANPIEKDLPQANTPGVLYFGPGVHEISTLELHDGTTLYLAGGAILRGILPPDEKPTVAHDWADQPLYQDFIRALGVKNIKICGRGIIDLSRLPWHSRKAFMIGHVSHLEIEGITLIGLPCWGVALFETTDVYIHNIKQICSLENSDGIDICNSQDVTVENCFLRNNDDEICVKTVEAPPVQMSKNIIVQNCVIWNERARGLGITNETRQDIDNVEFRNCDIIHDFSTSADCSALAVIVSDSGTISNIRFEDIRLEDVANRLALCCIVKDMWGHDAQRGHIKGVTFKNITVSGNTFPKTEIAGYDDQHQVEKVVFDHLTIHGKEIGDTYSGKISTNHYIRDLQISDKL